MRPRKGDLLVTLRDADGSITVLVEREHVRPHHRIAIQKMSRILTGEFMGAPTSAQVAIDGVAP